MKSRLSQVLPVVVTMALCACGSGTNTDSTSTNNPPAATGPQRGDLLQSPPAQKASFTGAELVSLLSGGDQFTQAVASLVESPKCSVTTYQLQYQTVGAKSEATSASGALMLP